MTRPVHSTRFALVGAGHIGWRHAAEMHRCGMLIAVADPLPERASAIAGRFGGNPYSSLEDLVAAEQPDVTAICTPNYLHAGQSILALRAGSHVLCEKPMCLHATEARTMIDVAKETGRQLFIVKQNRFNPPVQLVHQLLNEGRLGKILSFQVNGFWSRPRQYYQDSNWHGKKEMDGGILFTQFSHFIDLVCWLLGEVASIQVLKDNFLLKKWVDGEDTGALLLRMKTGAIGTFHYSVDAFQKNMEGSVTLLGEYGTVKIGGQYLNTLEYFSVKDMDAPNLPPVRPANDYGHYQGSMSNHHKVYDELLKALRGESFQLASAEEAARTVALIEKINTLESGN
ncbi:MAG TPA: Gfo/Idh/MocA family oxidoreductase [Puia sp.]|nr:Gfo/Idh/MocA family oxidoreductase [Puia sp.]